MTDLMALPYCKLKTARMRHTKIIATLGPASESDAVLAKLVAAGVDVFRLNFSHGTHAWHADVCQRVRAEARAAGRLVAVMQDLAGPKIRSGRLAGGLPVQLAAGAPLAIEIGDGEGDASRIFTSYAPLAAGVKPGDRLLLDDGRIELRVESSGGRVIRTMVADGGLLGERKGIAAPGVRLEGSALTTKDVTDLRFGLELGVNLVALSFVQSAEDVRAARRVMREAGREAGLVAKIERPAAVERVDEILDEADAVMIARGDLGLEMPLERVPTVQKSITRKAPARGKPAIVATQVLESMRQQPRPTRAEVSDAANAVDDGADAVMLSGETAAGLYPVEAVRVLDKVLREAEKMPPNAPQVAPAGDPSRTRHGRAMCEAAVTLARVGHVAAIVAVTRRGTTARLLSSLRPEAPIFAATDSTSVAEALALHWGVVPIVSELDETARVEQAVVRSGLVRTPATVVFVNVSGDLRDPRSNFLSLRRLA